MAARHYFHCFAAGSPGQANADVITWATTPNGAAVRTGRFEIWYRPSENAAAIVGSRYLLTCDDGAGQTLRFRVLQGAGLGTIQVVRNGGVVIARDTTYLGNTSLTSELRLVFDALEGRVTEYRNGALIGTSGATPWAMPSADCAMRLGGLYGTNGSEANGLVSLPYAVQA